MLAIKNLSKAYGQNLALASVDLDVAQGEFFGLLGPNGAGKSTLMSILAGFRQPDDGSISFNGEDLLGNPERRRELGLVPQAVALYEDLSATENLRLFGRLAGLPPDRLAQRIREVLDLVGLTDRAHGRIKSFSGGMQRRINIAVALLHEPRLLLCDEPTVGVDPQSRNAIFDVLQNLHRNGTTILYSTHYMEEAERLCTRIGVIDHGRLLALGTIDELLQQLPYQAEISVRTPEVTAELRMFLAAFGELQEDGERVHLIPPGPLSLAKFFSATENAGLPGSLFTVRRASLEAVFLHLTGKTLRD